MLTFLFTSIYKVMMYEKLEKLLVISMLKFKLAVHNHSSFHKPIMFVLDLNRNFFNQTYMNLILKQTINPTCIHDKRICYLVFQNSPEHSYDFITGVLLASIM